VNKKVLIAAPIGGLKQYSIMNWFEWIAKQTYENFDVCICTNGKESPELLKKLDQTEIYHKTGTKKIISLDLINSDDLSIVQKITYSREKIRRYAVENNYDYIFFLDTDTIPLFANAIQRLMDWKKPCVSGLYFYKGTKQPVVIDATTHTDISLDLCEKVANEKGLIAVWGFGFGCLLLDRSVFAECEFDYDLFGEERTDDFGYCHVMEQKGMLRWFDPSIICLHLADEFKPKTMNAGFFKVKHTKD